MDSQSIVVESIEGQFKNNERVFPIVYTAKEADSFMFLQQYFQRNRKQILEEVSKEGAVFFRGFNVKSPTEMATILNKLGLASFQYIGGAAVRRLIVGSTERRSENVQIFTTNQSPPSEPIPFHCQLMQNPNYPDYLSFYCYREAEQGGSTPLVSCVQLYNFIKENHHQFLEKLEQLQLRYIRIVGKQDNPNSPIGRGWKNIFKCETKQEAEVVMKQKGYQWQWLDNEDQDCRLISKPIPGVRVSKSGKKVFCNQFAVFKGWIDNKNKPSNSLRFGDFSEIPTEVLQSIYQHAYKIQAAIPWKVGDFVLIDNQMAMHARQPFKGVNRKIYASLFKGPKNVTKGLQLTLKSGDQMPIVGFGTWKLPPQVSENTIYNAIKNGYRLIDCAAVYGNEVQVGNGINRAINEGIVTRKQLFITSKIWCTFLHPSHVRDACNRTLSDLNLEYLDLYLIHFPLPIKYVDPKVAYPSLFFHVPTPTTGSKVIVEKVPIRDTWVQMQKLVEQKLVRNIGISNFNVSLTRDLLNSSKIPPAVNQIEIHPLLTQKKAIRYFQQNGVQITAYSSFGGVSYIELNRSSKEENIVEIPIIKELAEKYKKTGYQILLRWAVQQGLAIIPKTSQIERLSENSDVVDWSISQSDMKRIDELNCNKRYNDPGIFLKDEENYQQMLVWE